MISGRDFVLFSDDWNGLPTSAIHLFRLFCRQNRVFWFGMLNRMPRLTWDDAAKVTAVLADWSRRLMRVANRSNGDAPRCSEGPLATTPWMIPWFKPLVRRMNRISLFRQYESLRRQHGIRDPIVLTTWPSAVDAVKRIDAAVTIYYCVDEWLEYPCLNAADWQTMEDELLDHVDGLVATSRDLEKKCRPRCASLYLPHGVDFEHFNREVTTERSVAAMESIRRPIVGFFGFISRWVDLDVVAALSREYPDVSFVLIGKSDVSMDAIAACGNVHYLGAVAYDDLPRYARYFDAGLIPFVRTKLTSAVNPLKLLEYYALGLPVLATRLPELEQTGGPIYLGSTMTEFRENLAVILGKGASSDREKAVELARRNTWMQRAEQLSDFIESMI